MRLAKEGRKTVYLLPAPEVSPESGHVPLPEPEEAARAIPSPEPAASLPSSPPPVRQAPPSMTSTAMATFQSGMPRITGVFADFTAWEMELTEQLGDVDVSESLIPGDYTVYSHQYGEEATYQAQETPDGFEVS